MNSEVLTTENMVDFSSVCSIQRKSGDKLEKVSVGRLTSKARARRVRKEDREARVGGTVCVTDVSRRKANPWCQKLQ